MINLDDLITERTCGRCSSAPIVKAAAGSDPYDQRTGVSVKSVSEAISSEPTPLGCRVTQQGAGQHGQSGMRALHTGLTVPILPQPPIYDISTLLAPSSGVPPAPRSAE